MFGSLLKMFDIVEKIGGYGCYVVISKKRTYQHLKKPNRR